MLYDGEAAIAQLQPGPLCRLGRTGFFPPIAPRLASGTSRVILQISTRYVDRNIDLQQPVGDVRISPCDPLGVTGEPCGSSVLKGFSVVFQVRDLDRHVEFPTMSAELFARWGGGHSGVQDLMNETWPCKALADRWRARCRVVGSPCGAANCTWPEVLGFVAKKQAPLGTFVTQLPM